MRKNGSCGKEEEELESCFAYGFPWTTIEYGLKW